MQVPAPFAYARATSVEHAIELLTQHGPEARVVAGGHSLIPMMKLRLASPDALVDINDLAGLSYVRVEGDQLLVGALTRHADLLASAVAGEHYPIFHDAERVIADPVVRNFGTVGGSLCQADPSEDLSAAFAAVGATAVIHGPGGSRTVPVRELHAGPYETVLAPDELLTELRVQLRSQVGSQASPTQPRGGSAYQKVERRVGDYPVAAAGAVLWLAGDNEIADAGIGLTAVGAPHFAAAEAEAALRGAPATEESFAEAGRLAAAHCQPVADQRGPVDYKRHLAGQLTVRALRLAAARAKGEA